MPEPNYTSFAHQNIPKCKRVILNLLTTSYRFTFLPYFRRRIPKISLEESKGLSDIQIDQLTGELQTLANTLKGEVMIFELIEAIRSFLHKHNKPPSGSFYDQMLLEKLKRNEEMSQMQQQRLNQEQQIIREEVMKRKEILRSEATRARRDTRRSNSDSSPAPRTGSSSENSENSANVPYRGHMYPNECTDHQISETLYFSSVGRKILKGCCLGHSQKGCVTYSGIDLGTGQLLYVTEWNIKYVHLEAKSGHSVDDILHNIERQFAQLSQFRHKNLITYECLLTMKKKEHVVMYVVQDFVLGASVCSISSSLGWCTEGASIVARGVLDALIFLHNKGVSHSNLYDCTVFMDNSGTVRVSDFALMAHLLDMTGVQKCCRGDLPALGALIESLMPTPNSEMRDFIEKCKSERTLSASDLLEHPFLRPSLLTGPSNGHAPVTKPDCVPEKSGAQLTAVQHPIISEKSRLSTEFEILSGVGRGAFGDVLKVRNKLDNREYAIKRIPLTTRSRQLFKKMTREVELLSRLNHENVVRYYNSWIEVVSSDDKLRSTTDPLGSGGGGEWSITHESVKNCRVLPAATAAAEESSCSSDWMGIAPNAADDSSSDGIEFVNSDGEIVTNEDDDGDEASESMQKRERNGFHSPRPEMQIMCIQMEFCDKSTLRTAIDSDLCENDDRVWRLFREIAEGLSHIHQQGMIHRDLKPVNIFLDGRDQVKIGDFGLATTNFLALQSSEQCAQLAVVQQQSIELGSSLTGKVGTALYVAPELTGNASRATYNQKVDLYSLGIILFEMCSPKFETAMERVKVIAALRLPSVTIPGYLTAAKNMRHVEVSDFFLFSKTIDYFE